MSAQLTPFRGGRRRRGAARPRRPSWPGRWGRSSRPPLSGIPEGLCTRARGSQSRRRESDRGGSRPCARGWHPCWPRCPKRRRRSTETALENRLGPMLEFLVSSPRRAPHIAGSLHPHPMWSPAGPVVPERPFTPKRPGVPILTLPHLPTTSGAHLFGARFCCGPGQRSRNAGTRRWHDGSGRIATALWCTREGQEREGGDPPPTTATRSAAGTRWRPVWSVEAPRGPGGQCIPSAPCGLTRTWIDRPPCPWRRCRWARRWAGSRSWRAWSGSGLPG